MRTMLDPHDRKDLFDLSVFTENKDKLRGIDPALYDEIEQLRKRHLR